MHILQSADIGILYAIQDWMRSDFWTGILKFFTHLGSGGLFWILICLLLLAFRKYRHIGYRAAASLLLSALLANVILKHLFLRLRPFYTYPDLVPLTSPSSPYSFPSGHASSSFAVAFLLCMYLPKKYSVPALTMAALIGFSRMYLGVHYPSDILAGMAVGAFSAWMADGLISRVQKWHVSRETN